MADEFKTYFNSPIGQILITRTDTSIKSVIFLDEPEEVDVATNPIVEKCKIQLDEYFNSDREIFELKLEPVGSEFQMKVWNELLKIPFGKTITYLEQSKRIENAKSIRAVAKANSQNTIGIIIPCHRVIGKDGSLVGYGGGIWRKKWLIEHESKFTGEQLLLKI